MHKVERPSNYFSNSFTCSQAEQIEKGVICVQILLEIHLLNTVDSIFKVGQLLHTCLGHTQQAHEVKMMSMQCDNVT